MAVLAVSYVYALLFVHVCTSQFEPRRLAECESWLCCTNSRCVGALLPALPELHDSEQSKTALSTWLLVQRCSIQTLRTLSPRPESRAVRLRYISSM